MAKTKKPKIDPALLLTKSDHQAVAEGCWFDEEAADFVCDFISNFCTLTKGRKAGKKVELLGWQRALIRNLFGWKRKDGTRRYRTAYIEIGKKNGKSLIMSAVALYMLMADGESGAEVYLVAVNSKQARIIFDECKKMIACSPSLKKRLEIRDYVKRIEYKTTFSKIECATCDSESQDGFDSSFTCIDELGRAKTSKLFDVFEFAGAGRVQPLLVSITTAGNNKDSVCWREHTRSQKILDGSLIDTTHLAMIFSARPEDSIDDPKTWMKANPSLGHTISIEDFRQALAKVRDSPSQLNNFLRLRLNIWTDAETSYIASEVWNRCGQPIDVEALRGKPCHAGIDLSSKKDLTALVLLFGDETAGFQALPFFWIPEIEAKERERLEGIPYTAWAKQGFVTITPGGAIDYDTIVEKIVELSKTYRMLSLTSDEWGSAEAVCQAVAKKGVKCQFMRQGYRSMSEPTKELERQAILGKFCHGGNPILTWMNGHAVVQSDASENIKLVKPAPSSPKKIDGLIATVECMFAYLMSKKKSTNVYSTRKPEFVSRR